MEPAALDESVDLRQLGSLLTHDLADGVTRTGPVLEVLSTLVELDVDSTRTRVIDHHESGLGHLDVGLPAIVMAKHVLGCRLVDDLVHLGETDWLKCHDYLSASVLGVRDANSLYNI